jgi:hypothetical protein
VKVRFQADNDLRKAIVRGVVRSEPRIDFNSAQAARLDGVPDPEVLALSAETGRILVSHDFQTIPMHFQQFARARRSPGVLLIRQDLPVGKAVETLLLIWAASESEEWENRICLLPSLVTIAIGGMT